MISGTLYLKQSRSKKFIKKLDPPHLKAYYFAAQQLKYRDFLTICLS